MSKPNVKADIKTATIAIKEIMQENLSMIAQAMIAQIMTAYRGLPQSQVLQAINNITPKGINAYKDELKTAMAITAYDALKKARKEVPAKQNVRLAEVNEEALQLGEFDALPPAVQARILNQLKLLTGTQIADLEKVVFFQYSSQATATDSESQLEKDLNDAAQEYVDGNSVGAAAGVTSANIINEARLAFFLDDSVSDEIDAYQFTNGDPISEICQELAGQYFSKDDPNLQNYWPPLHFNCKSYMVPILKGNLPKNADLSQVTVSKSAADAIQFSEQNTRGLHA